MHSNAQANGIGKTNATDLKRLKALHSTGNPEH